MEPVELRGRRASSRITDHHGPERSRFGAFSFGGKTMGVLRDKDEQDAIAREYAVPAPDTKDDDAEPPALADRDA